MECDTKGMPTKQQSTEIRKHKKYICYYRGRYVFYDESAMEGRDGKWISLDNTTRRDTAYNYFKTAVLSVPERKDSFRRLILKEFAKEQAVWKGRIETLVKDGFHKYINELVCSDKNSLTYFARESGEVDILRREWAYIEKELYNALLNFK